MKINNVFEVYFSPTGTTKKVVNAIARGLTLKTECIDLTYSRNIEKHIFGPSDVVIFGAPVYGGRIPKLLEGCMENFLARGAMCVAVVVYGNRAFEDALKELYDNLKDRGFKVVAAGAFVGEHSYGHEIATGRPNEADLMTACKFGSAIGEKINKIQDDKTMEGVKVPGNYPYKERSAGDVWCPQTTDACVKCGQCAEVCPVGIIPKDHPDRIAEPEKCQHCCACVKTCPTGAKVMTSEFYKNIKQRLIENCTVKQNQPELFL